MKDIEKIKKTICSIVNDFDMDCETKFEVLEYLYNNYSYEYLYNKKICEKSIDKEELMKKEE